MEFTNYMVLFVILIVIIYIKSYYTPLKKELNKVLCDEMYLINLDRRPDRLKKTMGILKDYNYNNVVRFKAIDSSTFTDDEISSYTQFYARNPIYDNKRTEHHQLSRGAIGCYLSHLELWKDMTKNKKEKIVVFEDDTLPTINKNEIYKLLEKVPEDWDIILFGGIYRDYNHVFDEIYKLNSFFCTHAYIIRNTKNVEKLITEALPMDMQIDSYLSKLSKEGKLNIYGIYSKKHGMWGQNPKINNTNIQTPMII